MCWYTHGRVCNTLLVSIHTIVYILLFARLIVLLFIYLPIRNKTYRLSIKRLLSNRFRSHQYSPLYLASFRVKLRLSFLKGRWELWTLVLPGRRPGCHAALLFLLKVQDNYLTYFLHICLGCLKYLAPEDKKFALSCTARLTHLRFGTLLTAFLFSECPPQHGASLQHPQPQNWLSKMLLLAFVSFLDSYTLQKKTTTLSVQFPQGTRPSYGGLHPLGQHVSRKRMLYQIVSFYLLSLRLHVYGTGGHSYLGICPNTQY